MPPASPGLAVAALVVSICSAAVTLTGLAWQLMLYRLQGARLKVQLAFGYYTDSDVTITSTGPSIALRGLTTPGQGGLLVGVEYGLVRVTNIGRTAVSVENISFDFGRERWFTRDRIVFTPPEFHHPRTKNPDLSGAQRVEPGANVTAAYILWPTLAKFRHPGDTRDLIVRATATPVGRKPTRSSRRSAWRLPTGAQSWFSDLTLPPPDIRVYRVLWGARRAALHRDIMTRLNDGASADGIEAVLDAQGPPGNNRKVASDAHDAFQSVGTDSMWSGESPHRWWRTRFQRMRVTLPNIRPGS
jgi:hypothetical protein